MPLRHRDFEYTPQLETAAVWTSVAPTIAALVANLIVLGFAVAIFRNPKTRSLLRRQSLLMLLSVQVASVIQGVAYIVESFITGPTPWCQASVNIGFFTVGYINFIVTLVGVNLCISVVYSVHTSGWTKYYIGGSFAAALIIMIPGAIRGAWGWDVSDEECYVFLQEPDERFAWQLGTAYVWLILCCIASFTSTAMVLYSLALSRSKSRRLFTPSHSSQVSTDSLVRRVAVRIVWYPTILIVCTIPQITSDFLNDKDGSINSMRAYMLWIIAGSAYALQPLLLAIVTLFIDPSFSKAVRITAFPHWDTPLDPSSSPSSGGVVGANSTLVFTTHQHHPEAISMSALKPGQRHDGDSASAHTHDGVASAHDGKTGLDDLPLDGRDYEAAFAGPPGLPMPAGAAPPLQDRLRARAMTNRVRVSAL